MGLTLLVFSFLGGKQCSAERRVHGFREHSRFPEHKLITEDVIVPLVLNLEANRRKTNFTRHRRDRQALVQRHQ